MSNTDMQMALELLGNMSIMLKRLEDSIHSLIKVFELEIERAELKQDIEV